MNFASRVDSESKKGCAILLFSALLVTAGCGRDDVKVYRVAKEQPPSPHAQSQSALPSGHPDIATAKPQLSWTLPAGWKEVAPGQVSLATFSIVDKDGREAQVAVTPLGRMAGKEVPIVNMWRQQFGLSELSADEAEKQLKPVEIGGEPGKMIELTGKSEGTNPPVKIVTAMVHRPDASWFYKLVGDADLVEAQKQAFVSFLKSIKIGQVPATEVASVPASQTESSSSGTSQWKTPADWKAVAPGSMQVAKFSVPANGAGKADVMISIFPTSTGGALANVNRWRSQIGLPPVTEAELAKSITKLDNKNPDAILVDMTNNERQLIGAIVPRDGQWYFFKLLGDAAAVSPQKDAFIAFAKSPQ